MNEPTPTPGPTIRHAIIIFALAGLAAYFNSFQGAFIFDDLGMVVDPKIGKPLQGQLAPRPVVSLSFTLNYWLDGFNTRGYHLVNLLIHIAAAVTLFDLIRRTLLLPKFGERYANSASWLGFIVAFLWFVHPLNTQSVTYIIQRCESLMGLFILVSFWCFLRGLETNRIRWHILAGVACILASGCKELTLGVPLLAALYYRTFFGQSWKEAVVRNWKPLVLLSVGPALVVAGTFLRGFLTDKGGTVGFGVPRYTPLTYALTQTEVVPYYVWLSFWPQKLCLDYLDWPVRTSILSIWPWTLATILGLLALCWGVLRRRSWGFFLAWFFVILAPTSSFIPIQDAVFEHRMYLPLISVVALVVFGFEAVLHKFRVVYSLPVRAGIALLVFAVGAALTARTILRNEDYASDLLIEIEVLKYRPDNARSRMGYAGFLLRAGKPEEALREIEIAQQRKELISDFSNLASCYQLLGRHAEAEEMYAFLRQNRPTEVRTYALALALLQNGKPAEAEQYAREALSLNDVKSRMLLAACLDEQGRTDEARTAFADARRLAPDGYGHAMMTNARRTALTAEVTPFQLRMAYLDAKAAVGLCEQDDWETCDTLAICYARLGKFLEAVRASERAIAAASNRTEYEQQWLKDRLALFRSGKAYQQP